MPVNSEHPSYKAAVLAWKKCRDCYGGSDKVKAAGITYLPPLDSHAEDKTSYSYYLMRALFFNATRRTVQGLSGAVFQRGPVFETDAAVKPHTENVTLTGKSLETFGLGLLKEVLTTGRVGVLIDMPSSEDPKARPYWVEYKTEAIINWESHVINGSAVLTRVVLKENYYVPKDGDPFVLEELVQYRVLNLTIGKDENSRVYHQDVWRQVRRNEGDRWEIVSTVSPVKNGATLDFIPFIFAGPTTIQPEIEDSPILDLVEVNLSHFRTSADLEHGLHWTACPTPWATGIVLGPNEKLRIGSGEAWVFPDPNGRAGMLEFTGAGLGSLASADEKKRKMMSALGARLLEDSISSESTLGVKMRASGEHASLRTVVQQLDLVLTWCVKVHTWWFNGSKLLSETMGKVELNKDFIVGALSAEDVNALIALLQSEAISYETFYEKLTQGEMTRDGASVDDELKLIKSRAGQFKIAPPAPAGVDPKKKDLQKK